MELRAAGFEGFYLSIVDRHALGNIVLVHIAIDIEVGAGRSGAEQADDGGEGPLRLAAPTLTEEREFDKFRFDSSWTDPYSQTSRYRSNDCP